MSSYVLGAPATLMLWLWSTSNFEHFLHDTEKRGGTVLLAGLRPGFPKILRNLKFQDLLPADRFFPEEVEKYSATLQAIRHAYVLLKEKAAETRQELSVAEKEAIYYLV
jgi:SulP family sulfate permease